MDVDFDAIQKIADTLAGIFSAAGGGLDWIINLGGTLLGYLVSAVQWLVTTIGGWIA